ncbi:oxidoreductase domain-containing protein [Apiospora hydei]|uniref:Oxidoreductase domain-containing protein n=1 Tax=Apiospora hydei TaxID=1337664 RepID=A0ABR1UUU5_9PEZI
MASSKQFNVGVVGYGMSAKIFHIPFIKATPLLKLRSILQRSPKPGDSAPADYPDLQHHTALDSLLADPELDVVVLCTTPPTHFAFATAALEAGKHVCCEKPFVPTSAEAAQLAALASKQGKLLCVYQNRRYDADFATVSQLIKDGILGRVVEFETHFDRYKMEHPTNWKGTMPMEQGGGAVYDLGTHLVDQVYTLFGMPESVYAKFVSQRQGKFYPGSTADGGAVDPDSLTAHLYYPDTGLTAIVRIGVLSVETQQPRFWIRGSKGSYTKKGLDTQEPQLKGGMTTSDAKFGREGPEWAGKLAILGEGGAVSQRDLPNVEPPPTYAKIYESFARALASGKEEDVPVPASQARDVLKIIEAVQESGKTGREVPISS